jgi:hypothetical protein
VRKLNECELFKELKPSERQGIEEGVRQKLNQNVGVIAPEHIKSNMVELETKAKKGSGLLGDSINLYTQFNGQIKLFNIPATTSGRTPIPRHFPFTVARARNRQLENTGSAIKDTPAIFMNLYGVGRWSKDESEYLGLSTLTDLKAIMESATIMHRMLISQKAEKVLSNTKILEYLTGIYVYLFNDVVTKTMYRLSDEFQEDALTYLIGKFFLIYVLKKSESETLDQIAYKATKGNSSLLGLREFEDNHNFGYDSLSGFLNELGQAFFSADIALHKFTTNWAMMMGDATMFAIEYVPFLIHFLIAALYGAMLGGGTRLYKRQNDLRNKRLPNLYNALVAEVR